MNAVAPRTRPRWQNALDAQMALWRWYGREGEEFLADHWRKNSRELNAETQKVLRDLYLTESGRLVDCDPIFVSAEMCELVDVARESFAPEPLRETDLITPRGFLLYERPLVVPDRFLFPTTVAAVSWSRMFDADSAIRERIAHAVASDSGVPLINVEQLLIEDGFNVSGIAVTLYTENEANGISIAGAPALLPLHITPWDFGMTFDGNEWDENKKPTGAEWWWRVLQTTFRLMQQKIAVRHVQRPDRSARREARALRFREEPQVVVVRLRREESERHEPPGEAANYSHRFIVGGHWRNQWYPSISDHRQIWIAPYVKGPEGLPLIVRPRRVFQWQR